MKKILFITYLSILGFGSAFSQTVKFSPTADTSAQITLEGYIDTYFNYDFAEPADANMPYFVSQNRHNEFNINLAYISLKYTSDRVRATFIPGFGTYMNSNYAAERLTLRNIVEANVGAKIFKNKNIWLDVGVMGSPFTNESAISFDQPTLTRSFAPEYVPYYLTGARLTIPMGNKFTTYLFYLNGWQVIEDVNTPLAFASQFEYKPTGKLTLNLNTYYGYEKSPSAPDNRIRTFLDFYAIYKQGKFNYTWSAYIGNQVRSDSANAKTDNIWWQTNGTARYFLNKKNSLTARAEYFNDPKQVMIIPSTQAKGFTCASYSLGYNYSLSPTVLMRVEGRYFIAEDKVFIDENPTNKQSMLSGGFTIKF